MSCGNAPSVASYHQRSPDVRRFRVMLRRIDAHLSDPDSPGIIVYFWVIGVLILTVLTLLGVPLDNLP
jgi:hypothetical protein